jgi:hypothetical protein
MPCSDDFSRLLHETKTSFQSINGPGVPNDTGKHYESGNGQPQAIAEVVRATTALWGNGIMRFCKSCFWAKKAQPK